MPDIPVPHGTPERHAWDELSAEQVLERLVYELYGPLSALGIDLDHLATGTFEDEELMELLTHMQARVSDLSRLVVAIKRYNAQKHNKLGTH
ncbi:MAG: hypothetical protein SH847_07005 [Roseiflexaceae bacterium]|nr:hypothetical protein [Roseiflexaceae bacterium]